MEEEIFISYSRKDIAFARLLVDALKAQQMMPWIDWEDIPPSADWLAEIYRAIEGADAFVFILSPVSARSEVCSQEIEHALKNNKRVIPIALPGVKPEETPRALAALNWIFFPCEPGEEFQQAFARLVQAAQTDLEWVRLHTRLQVRALEWMASGRKSSYMFRDEDLLKSESLILQNMDSLLKPTQLQLEMLQASKDFYYQEQRNRIRRLTTISISISVLLIVAIGSFVIARRNALLAEAKTLAANAQLLYSVGDQENAFVMARFAIKNYPYTAESEVALANILHAPFELTGSSPITNFRFSRDGKEVFLIDSMKRATVWSIKDQTQLFNLEGNEPIIAANWSRESDPRFILGITEDQKGILWDAKTGLRRRVFTSMVRFAFSPDGNFLAYINGYSNLYLLDLRTDNDEKKIGEAKYMWWGWEKQRTTLFFYEDNLFSIDEEMKELDKVVDVNTDFNWSPEGRFFLHYNVGNVLLQDLTDNSSCFIKMTKNSPIFFSPDTNTAAVVEIGEFNIISLLNTKNCSIYKKLIVPILANPKLGTKPSSTEEMVLGAPIGGDFKIGDVIWGPTGDRIAVQVNNSILIFDEKTARFLYSVKDTGQISNFSWAPSSDRLGILDKDGKVKIKYVPSNLDTMLNEAEELCINCNILVSQSIEYNLSLDLLKRFYYLEDWVKVIITLIIIALKILTLILLRKRIGRTGIPATSNDHQGGKGVYFLRTSLITCLLAGLLSIEICTVWFVLDLRSNWAAWIILIAELILISVSGISFSYFSPKPFRKYQWVSAFFAAGLLSFIGSIIGIVISPLAIDIYVSLLTPFLPLGDLLRETVTTKGINDTVFFYAIGFSIVMAFVNSLSGAISSIAISRKAKHHQSTRDQ